MSTSWFVATSIIVYLLGIRLSYEMYLLSQMDEEQPAGVIKLTAGLCAMIWPLCELFDLVFGSKEQGE